MRLFLSYSRRDAAYAERLRAGLEAAGHDVWIDRDDIVAGEQWRTSIVEAITEADAVVLVISPPSMTSEHVLREVSFVFDQRTSGIVEPGRRTRAGIRFAVVEPPSGTYTLVVTSQQAAFGNPTVRDAAVAITVP